MIGLNDGTIVATMLAESHPELCRVLVLWTLTASHTLAAGRPLETIDDVVQMIEADTKAGRSGVNFLAPSRVNYQDFDQHLARLQRYSVRPGAYAHYYRRTMEADVNRILPSNQTPDAGPQSERQSCRAHGAITQGRHSNPWGEVRRVGWNRSSRLRRGGRHPPR